MLKELDIVYNDFIKKQTLTISFPSDIGGGYVKNSFSKKKYNKKRSKYLTNNIRKQG